MCYPDADKGTLHFLSATWIKIELTRDSEHLRNAMDFLNWLFSFDDSFDEELRGNADATKIASEIVVSKQYSLFTWILQYWNFLSDVLQDPINYRTEYRLGQQLQE